MQQAEALARSAFAHLEAGNEDPARQDLQRALALDPTNKHAQSLDRQMTADPAETARRLAARERVLVFAAPPQ